MHHIMTGVMRLVFVGFESVPNNSIVMKLFILFCLCRTLHGHSKDNQDQTLLIALL